MCEANVYMIDKAGKETLVLDAVNKLIPQGDSIFLENIFCQRKTLKAAIKEMVLVDHKIILREIGD